MLIKIFRNFHYIHLFLILKNYKTVSPLNCSWVAIHFPAPLPLQRGRLEIFFRNALQLLQWFFFLFFFYDPNIIKPLSFHYRVFSFLKQNRSLLGPDLVSMVITTIACFVQKSRMRSDGCTGALSWYSTHFSLAYISGSAAIIGRADKATPC